MLLIIGRHGKAEHNEAFERHYGGGQVEGLPAAPHSLGGLCSEEVPLVELGVRQAQAAGGHLKERGILPQVVFVSPTVRTYRTWIEFGFSEVDAVTEPRLREQEGGQFDRLPLSATEALRNQYTREAWSSPDARPPEGESIREHLARVEVWFQETVANHPVETVLAIAHYGTMGLVGMLCEGLSLEQYLADRPSHLSPGCGDLLGYRRAGDRWKREFHFRNPAR